MTGFAAGAIAAAAMLALARLLRARRSALVAARLHPRMCGGRDLFTMSARATTSAHGWVRARRADPSGDLLALVESVGSASRAGASLHQALVIAAGSAPATLRGALHDAVSRASHGQPLADALREWAGTAPHVAPVARALALAHELGGHAPRVTDALAESLRERRALASEVRALSSQARASAAILVIAPFVVATLLAAVDSHTAAFLLGSPAGLGCIAGGVLLDAAGALWMVRLCRVQL
jgi:tight adherence protein B